MSIEPGPFRNAPIIAVEVTSWVNNCRAIQPRTRLLYPQKLPPLSPTRAAAKGRYCCKSRKLKGD